MAQIAARVESHGDPYEQLAKELERPAPDPRAVRAVCLFCRHEWMLVATMIDTGLRVTQCPSCRSFLPQVWHREMFSK